MGLRDALKSLRGGSTHGALEDISVADAPDPDWFRPRFDGSYRVPADAAAAAGAGAHGIELRFLPSGRVAESADPDESDAGSANPCQGEYTAAGRFNVQRRFERIISYAVLEMQPDGFIARRINAADRSTAELPFTFAPDVPAQGQTPGA